MTAPATPEPRQLPERTKPTQPQRRVATEQAAQEREPHAGAGPGQVFGRRGDTRMRKARLRGHAGAALEHADFVSVGGKFICCCGADDAGTDDGDAQGFSLSWPWSRTQ